MESRIAAETLKRLYPIMEQGDLRRCEVEVVDRLKSVPHSPFHIALKLAITNCPVETSNHFDSYFENEGERLRIGAAYTGLNNFTGNPDHWYAVISAYSEYGGYGKIEWLCQPQSETLGDFTILGLEELQEVYSTSDLTDPTFRDAENLTSLLVIIKFQRFIERAAANMENLRFPLLAGTHDCDLLAEFRPSF